MEYEPRIIAFVCNWCTYLGADLAGTSRMEYSPNVRIIRFPCTGRIDPLYIIKAFERGADGVLVSGCHPGECHYREGNFYARRKWIVLNRLLRLLGISEDRVQFSWISASEGAKWVNVVEDMTDRLKTLGPFSYP